MVRALAASLSLLVVSAGSLTTRPLAAGQDSSVLHIKVTVSDAERGSIPVARHALLISANPSSAIPRRIVTSLAGTADVRLRPGNYTVESETPAAVLGRAYQWMQIVDVPVGREATLELTASNATVGAVTGDMTSPSATVEYGGSSLLTQWQDSVVEVWTDRRHASGFLVDGRGLVATSQRAIADSTAVQVQLSPTVKVAATVVVADSDRDVAMLRIDPEVAAGVRPVPLGCGQSTAGRGARTDPPEERFAIEVALRGSKHVSEERFFSADAAGGPVFAAAGALVGLTSSPGGEGPSAADVRVVPASAVCEVLASAQGSSAAAPPGGVHLPVESARFLPAATVKAAAGGGTFSLNPYRLSSSDFDVVFITPVLVARAESKQGWSGGPDYESSLRALSDFGGWSDYVAQSPPVLLVRVTPRLVEGFWMKVARGAAETQGVSIPPIKRFRPGFAGMRLLCGVREVTPIHPFRIEQRLSESEAILEGLYAFNPAALGPECGTVMLELSSAKEPDRAESRTVDPAIIRRISQDFASLAAQR
jgi:hypothetical protein